MLLCLEQGHGRFGHAVLLPDLSSLLRLTGPKPKEIKVETFRTYHLYKNPKS